MMAGWMPSLSIFSQVTIGGTKEERLYVANGTRFRLRNRRRLGERVDRLRFCGSRQRLANSETPSDPWEDVPRFRTEIGITATPVIDRMRNAIYSWHVEEHRWKLFPAFAMRST